MKQLIPSNHGGGLQPSPEPSANLSAEGALVLNIAAEKLIQGVKWIVRYEDDPKRTPTIELQPTTAEDHSGYTVTRSGGSVAKVRIRSLWRECKHADRFVGRYRISKIAHGLRLTLLTNQENDK